MRIPCPFCGDRPSDEFTSIGTVAGQRPDGDAPLADFVAYQHIRANPAGEVEENWHHQAGCRQWLIITRDTRTHLIKGARLARGRPA